MAYYDRYDGPSDKVLLTTTPNIDGYRIIKYIDVISEEVLFSQNLGHQFGNMVRDEISKMTAIFSDAELTGTAEAVARAKNYVKNKLKEKAVQCGANAVIGVDIETSLGTAGTWIRVSINGTAVIYKSEEQFQKEQEARLLEEKNEAARQEQLKLEAQENAKRVAEAKLEAAKNPGSFVYAVHEPIFSSFSSAKDLFNYLESLKVEDDYFKNEVLPRIQAIKATETFRSHKLNEAIAALKEMTT